MAIALLIARLIIGLGLAAHGSQKLFGWFGGGGIAGTSGFMETLGFRPGRMFALAAGLGELIGGLLTVLGLFGALGPAIIVMVMLVAIFTVHGKNGYFNSSGGWEMNAVIIAGSLALAFAGSGVVSIDAAAGLHVLTNPAHVWIAMAVALVLALLNLAARRPAAATQS